MGTKDAHDVWANGDSYERYVGRWSRAVAREFIRWLAVQENSHWLDVGCGTGALSQTVLEMATPKSLKGIDRSEAYVEFTRSRIHDSRTEFEVGKAQSLPVESGMYDAAVSGLVLNFVQQPDQMVAEMVRAVRKQGTVALYVWDYSGKMEFMRHFWDAAAALDSTAFDLDEGRRFSICNPQPLRNLFENAGLSQVDVCAMDVPTHFRDFDDYWGPFLGGQGSAPGYLMSLSEEMRAQIRERIRNSLPFARDGSIPLAARVWAIKGVK